MPPEKSIALEKESVSSIAQMAAVLGLVIILPFFHNQLITGPIINAIFFISVILLGVHKTLYISLIPSVIALSVGLLPFIIYPIVPVLMIGNIIQIAVFNFFKKKYFLAMVLASLSKFIFIFFAGSLIFNVILKESLADSVSLIISWPQLFTALTGGVLAYFFLKIIKKV